MANDRFAINIVEEAAEELAAIRPYVRSVIVETIIEQLTFQPTTETKNKKKLAGVEPPWKHLLPLRQLRIGEYRVFYDVEETEGVVNVHAVRFKPANKTTEDIL